MNLYRFGWVGAFLAIKVIGAEVAPQQCALGVYECYLQQHISACGTRGQSTPQSCRSWASSLEGRATGGDRAALRAQAGAYGFLASFDDSAIGRESAKQAALERYRELLASDPEDADALVGIATFTESGGERAQSLRDSVRLEPDPITVNALISDLRRAGTKGALLEAAKVADDFQRVSEGRTKWRFAAEARDLYKSAGDSQRAAEVRQRAQQDAGVPAVLRELSTIRVSNPGRTAELLDSICRSQIARTIGAQPCLTALEMTVPSLGEIPDREVAQRLADQTAGTMEQLTREARSELEETDPDWYPELLGLLNRIHDQGLGSVTTWFSTFMVDRTLSGKTRALEKAVSFAPDSAQLLSGLATSYAQQGRWEEAIAHYRRAKAVTPPDRVDEHRSLDSIIEAVEAMRAGRPVPSPR